MEELSKNQLILLALLVSFVTSIATGIATVSLIDQAPPRVTQTINRVVERTIETITPSGVMSGAVKETTVVVKEEDVITESIGSAQASLVRLYADRDVLSEEDGTIGSERKRVMVGLAVLVSDDGLMVTASDDVLGGSESRYDAVLPDGENVSAEVKVRSHASGVAVLNALVDPSQGITFTPLPFADTKTLRLGQTVLLLEGNETTTVGEGIISSLITTPEGDATVLAALDAAVVAHTLGAPIVNMFGELVGLADMLEGNRFIPVNVLQRALDDAAEQN